MKTKHIIIGVVLLLAIAGGFFIYKTIGSLDQIIATAVNKYGSEITGADVHLDGVALNIPAGEASLRGLYIGNPEGFHTDYAMKLDQVKVILDIDSIMEDIIVIKEILVEKPDVIYEFASGGSNIDVLSGNVQSFTGAGDTQQKEQSEGPKLIIADVYITDGNVSVSHSMLKGKKLSAPMPDIHLEDIGKDEGGASPGEVAQELMTGVKTSVGSAVASLNIGENLQKAGGAIKEGAGAVVEKGKEVGEKIKGLFQ